MTEFFSEVGALWLFFTRVVRTALTTSGNLSRTCEQIYTICMRSLPTVLFSGVFVGAILVLQFNLILSQYDAQIFLGGLNTSAVVREVGPLIISFLLAGKIGAYTAAELGTMRVTEQIDAIECLGTNPLQYLVVPRFIGIIIASTALLTFGLMISVLGAMGIASALCGINPLQFLSSIPKFTDQWTLLAGLFKSTLYACIVATVACQKGFSASGGARGVGKAVTQAAVYTNLFIVIANYLSSNVLDMLAVVFGGGH